MPAIQMGGGSGGGGGAGANGKSAYELWLDLGNTGSLADFLNSLEGAPGIPGEPGLKWRGAWAAGTAYAVNDAVAHAGGSYRRTVAGTTGGNPASDPANWAVLAQASPPLSITNTYASQTLTVGATETQLAPPAGANRALVIVTAGAARIGLGDAQTAPVYTVDAGVDNLQDAQLAALRLVRSGAVDATVRADYWRVG